MHNKTKSHYHSQSPLAPQNLSHPGGETKNTTIASIQAEVSAHMHHFDEDGGMNRANLHRLARAIGIESPDQISTKTELIRAIQAASHQRPCFRSDQYMLCQDDDCIWKMECKKLIAEWMR